MSDTADMEEDAAENPLAADTRPAVYREGDLWVMRASSFGWCDVALCYAAAGTEGEQPTEAVRRAWAFGAAHEHHVIDEVAARGWRALTVKQLHAEGWEVNRRNGQPQGVVEVPGGKIRAHPDGIVEGEDGERRVLEVKIMAEGNDPLTKAGYLWQFGIEQQITGLPLLVAVAWKKDSEDGDKGDGDGGKKIDRVELFYGEDIADIPNRVNIKTRAMKLVKLFNGGEIADCHGHMFPCPYYPFHAVKDHAEGVERLEGDEAEQLAMLLHQREELSAEKKKLDSAYNAVNAQLDELITPGTEDEHTTVAVEGYVYDTWVKQVPQQTTIRKAHQKTYRTIKRTDDE